MIGWKNEGVKGEGMRWKREGGVKLEEVEGEEEVGEDYMRM